MWPQITFSDLHLIASLLTSKGLEAYPLALGTTIEHFRVEVE
jgi:hypothetical protein